MDNPHLGRKLATACRVLFGSAPLGRPGFLQELQPGQLKAAYRQLAKRSHPDHARSLGIPEGVLRARFTAINDAYQTLEAYLNRRRQRDTPEARFDAHDAPQTEPQQRAGESLPPRPLEFSEYVYRQGLVSHETYQEARRWQHRQRPLVGRVAVEFGFMTMVQVAALIRQRAADGLAGVPLARYAEESGAMTPLQRLAVLGKQRKHQLDPGKFFVDEGILDPGQVELLAFHHRLHNLRYAS